MGPTRQHHQGEAYGAAEEKTTPTTRAEDRVAEACTEDPRLVVRSDESGRTAMHKPEELGRARPRCGRRSRAGPARSAAQVSSEVGDVPGLREPEKKGTAMASDETSPTGSDGGPTQQRPRTGQGRRDEGGYFQGEGHDPFAGEARDGESREGEAAAADLLDSISAPQARSGPQEQERGAPTGGPAADDATGGAGGATRGSPRQPDAGDPEGTAGASGTSRGSTAASPGAGRMG